MAHLCRRPSAARYCIEDVPWGKLAGGEAVQAGALRLWLCSFLQVLQQVGDLALPPLSRTMETNVGAEDVDEEYGEEEGGGGVVLWCTSGCCA